MDSASLDWKVVKDGAGSRVDAIEALLCESIGRKDLVVEVHRKLGAFLPFDEAVGYIANHIGEGEIRVSDRSFSGFAVFTANGVAACLRQDG